MRNVGARRGPIRTAPGAPGAPGGRRVRSAPGTHALSSRASLQPATLRLRTGHWHMRACVRPSHVADGPSRAELTAARCAGVTVASHIAAVRSPEPGLAMWPACCRLRSWRRRAGAQARFFRAIPLKLPARPAARPAGRGISVVHEDRQRLHALHMHAAAQSSQSMQSEPDARAPGRQAGKRQGPAVAECRGVRSAVRVQRWTNGMLQPGYSRRP